jgi:AcrR family transcriptional regulator
VTSDRSEQILDAALSVFCQYGYGKTTMQDVARAAGMSRAALYLHFPTKEELFRAGSRRAHSWALDRVDAALAAPDDVVARIDTAMAAYIGALMAQVSSSVHRGELLDAGLGVASDIVRDGHAELVTRLTAALNSAVAAGQVQLSAAEATAEDIAGLLVAAADGLMKVSADPQVWQERRALFFRLVRAAIAAPDDNGTPTRRRAGRRQGPSGSGVSTPVRQVRS